MIAGVVVPIQATRAFQDRDDRFQKWRVQGCGGIPPAYHTLFHEVRAF
jgi:hypothetical protein